MLARRFSLPLLAAGFLGLISIPAVAEEPDFWKVQQDIRKMVQSRNIGQLASQPAPESAKTNPEEAMRHFFILVLAGYDDQAAKFLSVLQLHRETIGKHNQSQLADELIRRERWNLVRRYLEALPGSEPGWGYVFLKKWNESASPEILDQWLDQRTAAFPLYWSREHFQLAALQKRQDILIEAYHDRLKANPKDSAAAMQLVLGYQKNQEAPSIDWLADLYHPASPSEAYQLAQPLSDSLPHLALKFFIQARDLPFGEADIAFMNKRRSQMQSIAIGPDGKPVPEKHEKDFRALVRHEMMNVYKRIGQPAEAQKLLEEIAAEYPDGLPPGLMHNAGQIQAASGARVIEGRILDAEKKPENQNSPEYWRERCSYYRGRKEYQSALEAAQKFLAMTSIPEKAETAQGKGGGGEGQMRYWALNDIAACLQDLGKGKDAFDLFRQELAAWPPQHPLADHLATKLATDLNQGKPKLIQPDDEVFWAWLAARKDWSYGAERLLRVMAENTGTKKEPFWDRAQKLALKDPQHSAVAGWIMLNQNQTDRALICLQNALKGLPEGDQREDASVTLFRLYLDQYDWKNAALTLPKAANRYSYEEYAERFNDLAECAASSGSPKEAIQFWAQGRDHDRWSGNSLKNLLKAGMRKDLIAYYENLIQKEPACVVAKEQLSVIKSK